MIDEIEDVTELKARALCCIIAKNTAIDMVRKHSRIAPTEDVFIELEARQKPADSPDAVVESKAETERIRLALNRLPESYSHGMPTRDGRRTTAGNARSS